MRSLKRVLIRELVVLHALVVAAVAALAWVGLSRWALQSSEARVSAQVFPVDQALTDQFFHLEALADLLEHWWQDGTLDPLQDRQAWDLLRPAVAPHPVLAGVNLVRVDGQGFGLGHLEQGWGGRSIRREGGHWLSGPILGLAPAGSGPVRVGPAMDFRSRPWFQLGQRLQEGQWTEPYRYIGRLEGAPGISYVRPVRTRQGDLLGVISLDVLLASMTQTLREVSPNPAGRVTLLDGEGRMIAPPVVGASGASVRTPHEAFLSPLAPADDPVLWRLRQQAPAPGTRTTIRRGWHRYDGLVRPFEAPRGLHWQLLVAVPSDDLLSDPLRRGLAVMGLGILLSAILAWRVAWLGQQVAGPLASLEAAAASLGQTEALTLPESNIQEIRGLSRALQETHEAQRERDRLQEHLRQHQKLDTVGTLAGGIAHDVNNQLTAILGQITLGRERLAAGQDADANLKRAEEATRRCADTTRALLSFSRPAASERVSLDLNAVVREAALLLKRGLGPAIHLELALSPELPSVLGDAVQLEQVLLNLGLNARDALPAGGLIRLGTAPLGEDEVLLWVEDNGVGMRPEVQARIFDPFFTTKPVGQGSGLGLSMVHGIARAHDATLEVDSEWGRGTTIRLRLPASRTPRVPATAPTAAPSGPWLKGRRLLVVEDEPTIREVLVAALERAGASCEAAADGEEGWRLWQAGTWDLVVSDHLMPRLTGLELLERLRQDDPRVPIILASGRGLEAMEDRLTADPRLRLLAKPFHLTTLLLTVRDLLEG